jgi:hypothetical protein
MRGWPEGIWDCGYPMFATFRQAPRILELF